MSQHSSSSSLQAADRDEGGNFETFGDKTASEGLGSPLPPTFPLSSAVSFSQRAILWLLRRILLPLSPPTSEGDEEELSFAASLSVAAFIRSNGESISNNAAGREGQSSDNSQASRRASHGLRPWLSPCKLGEVSPGIGFDDWPAKFVSKETLARFRTKRLITLPPHLRPLGADLLSGGAEFHPSLRRFLFSVEYRGFEVRILSEAQPEEEFFGLRVFFPAVFFRFAVSCCETEVEVERRFSDFVTLHAGLRRKLEIRTAALQRQKEKQKRGGTKASAQAGPSSVPLPCLPPKTWAAHETRPSVCATRGYALASFLCALLSTEDSIGRRPFCRDRNVRGFFKLDRLREILSASEREKHVSNLRRVPSEQRFRCGPPD
uniref:PX domain-containing protein n=1 Tax=Chromera velia CCMP2878 TaxID=1169474 RepID=A0A0G4FFR7_9ALVE|mmetsp:Transcript_44043/g.86948  ORF Transcript_44043/g.86948 Transcript_44043/m.86948 type:complete len:377 (+) Transcript_44043:194-1324(+)|eukprot:Cvel_16741.t1-p1 / transcript=Cvel_16741.t1 / gene=Cvel_16741 / organism=Chromera_velia_CCMP2878 / gene_product=hypothetical protein / transcript_product=hypothetical protein / location=Cvel_scaffold1302:44300-45427(+) / protein_length=376 / sequence_SO=supercontig / SO=protein_coding / is_pseudo=false